MAFPLIPVLLGLTAIGGSAAYVDQEYNQGDATKGIGEMLTNGVGNLSEGAGLSILKTVMSEEAAKTLLESPAEFASNIGKYAKDINWGAGAGLAAGIYFAATANLPTAMQAAIIPAMTAIFAVGYNALGISSLFNKNARGPADNKHDLVNERLMSLHNAGPDDLVGQGGAVDADNGPAYDDPSLAHE